MPGDSNNPLVPSGFDAMFGIVAAIVVLGIIGTVVFIIVTATVRARKITQAGYNPLTVDQDLVVRALESDALRPAAPAQTLEGRLAELDDLRARGVISDEEHRAARSAALGVQG